MSGIEVAPYEVEVLTKDGRKLPFEINAEKIDYKGKTADMVVFRNISDRKQMEHELKDSEERFRLMFENAPDGYYLHDLKGTFINGNSTAEKLTGYKREELIGKSFTKLKLLPKGQLPKAVGNLAKSALGKHTGPDEFTLNRKDGGQVSVEINSCPIKIKGKTLVLGIARDITERKQAEKELKDAHEMLMTVNKSLEGKVEERTAEINRLLKQKDEFIGQLGHDLKNPLGPLINLLPLLEKNETDPERKETFEILNRNANHMKNLVVNTIELARLNSPNVKLNIEDTNLLDELNNVIKRNNLLFEENNVEVENKISEDIVVNADKLRLTELFDNLIGNSVKYSSDSGTITIDAKQDKDFVTVSIKDTGIGIAEEQLSHIFDEFYKADESRHDFDSSGLGLPICKHIVEKHGGHIWAESEGEGKGTTMFFTLPVSKNEVK